MSENANTSTMCTPPELSAAANELRNDLLPAKSRDQYLNVYETFIKWKTAKGVTTITENVLLAYFGELAKEYKPSTLWAKYSMLKSVININHKINLENFKQLTAFLKQKSRNHQAKKSKIFSSDEMNAFLSDAPDNKYLATKVSINITSQINHFLSLNFSLKKQVLLMVYSIAGGIDFWHKWCMSEWRIDQINNKRCS